jgi:hypothetical protein
MDAVWASGTYRQCNGDGCEHSLVDCEHEVRDLGRANGWRAEDIAKADVFKVTNEGARAAREHERIAPEEPLEADQGCGCDREPD